jgi:glycosyltransferase involved in cell wall biosynthesis
VAPEKTRVVGIGVSAPEQIAEEKVLQRHGIRPPYIFYCGRRERGKNFDLLVEMFREFKKQNPHPLQFVSAGSGRFPIAPSEKGSIIDAGFVSEDVKARLYRSALLTCQPSTKESFSIVIMESWLQGRPVVVCRRAAVTHYWTDLCHGGFSFDNFFDFEEILRYAAEHPDVLDAMGRSGHEFAMRHFQWETITDRFYKALLDFGYMV